jgi:hypothetical protein
VSSPRPFRFERTGNRQFDQFQRELATALATLLLCPFVAGKALRGLTLAAATPTPVRHGLGQPLANWIVLRLQASSSCSIIELAQAGNLYASQITLEASANCTLDLWVS